MEIVHEFTKAVLTDAIACWSGIYCRLRPRRMRRRIGLYSGCSAGRHADAPRNPGSGAVYTNDIAAVAAGDAAAGRPNSRTGAGCDSERGRLQRNRFAPGLRRK